jgi:hypothetical protein
MTSSALRVGLVVPRFAPFRGGTEPDVEAVSQFADAMAQLLSSTGSCNKRAARCTLPSAAEIVEQRLETLTVAIVSRP